MTEEKFYKELSKRLKAIRKKSGLKQKELAEKMGITSSFVGNVENERERASAYRLNQMLLEMNKPSLLDILDNILSEKKTPSSKLKLTAIPTS